MANKRSMLLCADRSLSLSLSLSLHKEPKVLTLGQFQRGNIAPQLLPLPVPQGDAADDGRSAVLVVLDRNAR